QAYRWAIYFRPVGSLPIGITQSYTLEVFGIQMRDRDKQAIVGDASVDMMLITGVEPTIAYPDHDGENDLCPSNFVPYGLYNPPGTLTVALSGGVSLNASSISYDALNNFWSAQFDAFDQPTSSCVLTVTQGVNSTRRSRLGFGNC